MRKLPFFSFLAATLLVAGNAKAQNETTVSFDSGSQTLYTNAAETTPLSGGAAATLGDGAMLQLGYYTQATNANPFAGVFELLAGTGSANTFSTYGNTISIGDDPNNGAGDGSYSLTLNFVTNTASGNNLPANGQLLAIRFFDNTTAADSTEFNAVSAPTWVFVSPATPASSVVLSLDDPGLTFQDGSTDHFYTDISTGVPEPSTYALVLTGIGALAFFVARRRIA